jgi:hypothetical protein
MSKEIVIVNPHTYYFKRQLQNLFLRKPHTKYFYLYDYLDINTNLTILYDPKVTSLSGKIAKIFAKYFRTGHIEILIWLKINKLKTRRASFKHLYKLNSGSILFFMARMTTHEDIKIAKQWSNLGGRTAFHMTHYFKNTNNIKEILTITKKRLIVSCGGREVLNSEFYKDLRLPDSINHLLLPDSHNHLKSTKSKPELLQIKCLMVGSLTLHNNERLYKLTSSNYLHLDRSEFFKKAELFPEKFWVDDRKSYANVEDLYNSYPLFFTGQESIGLSSINLIEGMFFGCLLIAPKKIAYNDYGLLPGIHYGGYEKGNWASFLSTVDLYLKNEKLRLKVASNGQKFIIDQFNMDAIGTKLLDGLESDFK